MHEFNSKTSILVVDDEEGARAPMCEFLLDEGYGVHSAADGVEAIAAVEAAVPDIIMTDIRMPNVDGLTLIERVREAGIDSGIIVMTAFESVETAVDALKRGADDYLVKPIHLGQLLVVLDRMCRQRRLRKELRDVESSGSLGSEPGVGEGVLGSVSGVLGESIQTLAPLTTNVLIYGEVGTGKVPVARAIHAASENSSIVRVLNCAVHGERTAYELLFGVDGADGWLMETGSTLILADVEHLTGTVQERLHVALAEAGTADTPRGARIISTTALDMQDEMDSGRFLPSLGRMLSTVRIRVPTLRERHAELVPMIQGAFAEAAARYHVKEPRLSSDALEAMVGYSWPGNLRELRQVVERAVLLSEGEEVLISHFPEGLCVNSNQLRLPLVPGASLRELERFTLLETLEQVGGSTTKAAKILGISPRKIQYRLNEYREEELAARSAGAEKR